METIWHDIRYAVRRLLRSPGFTVVALLTLILGIGANSAIFSVVNSVLLRPLSYPDPDRIVTVWGSVPQEGVDQRHASEPEVLDYQRSLKSFSAVGAFVTRSMILSGGDDPEMVAGAYSTAGLFPALGATAGLGRAFDAEEDKPGIAVAVLSHGLWRRRFGSDPAIVGKTVMVNEKSHTVVGVMKPTFRFPDEKTELWLPLAIDPSNMSMIARGEHYLNVIARLAPNVSLGQAQSEMDALTRTLASQYPGFYDQTVDWRIVLTPLQRELVGNVRPALFVLLGAVGFVLLIACANVTNLLLVRAQSQEKEIAVRTALGASRARLVRQLFTESLLLSLVGGGLGLLVASWTLKVFVTSQARNLPRYQEVHIDGWVLAFTLLVALLTAGLVGLVPALRSSRFDVNETLKQAGGRSQSMGRHQTRNLLVVSEMAAALILLIGAGLLMGAFYNLSRIDPGFHTADVITMRITLPRTRYPEAFQSSAFFQQLAAGLESLGVKAGLVSQLPFGTDFRNETFFIEGRFHDPGQPATSTNPRAVSRDYFETLGIPVLQGRVFGSQDSDQSPRVAVIDETMVRRFWPEGDPIGKRVAFVGEDMVIGPYITIVGVVGDVKEAELQSDAEPHLYVPFQQRPSRSMYLALRSPGGRFDHAVNAIRREVRALDRGIPVYEVQPLEARLSQSIANQRLMAFLLTLFAGLAVLLAAIGLYGVMSYSVVQRTHEFGIRVALGAGRGEVVAMVLRQGLLLALVGLALGLLGALGLTRLMASQVYGLRASGPLIFLAAPIMLVLVALIASYLPARRTTRVDPVIALRYE
jgi:putative ABC transport system permease protein